MSSRSKRLRGYLLVEALVSGAIIAVGLLGVIVQLGAARDAEVRAERRNVASTLAKASIDELRALPFSRLSNTPNPQPVVVDVGGVPYARRISIQQSADSLDIERNEFVESCSTGAGGVVACIGSVRPLRTTYQVQFKQIVVDVSFGDPRRPTVIRLESRVYED